MNVSPGHLRGRTAHHLQRGVDVSHGRGSCCVPGTVCESEDATYSWVYEADQYFMEWDCNDGTTNLSGRRLAEVSPFLLSVDFFFFLGTLKTYFERTVGIAPVV